MDFAAKLSTSSGVNLLRWLPETTIQDEWLLLRNFAPVLVWTFYGDFLTGLHKTNGFSCEPLHQFWCETFTVIAWHDYTRRTAFAAKLCTSSGAKLLRCLPNMNAQDKWILLPNFAPVLVWIFYGDCQTRLYKTNGLLLRNFAPVLVWNFYGDFLTLLHKTNGFCCEHLHQFWFEPFTVISWHDYTRRMAFPAKLCTSSGVKRLRWFPDRTAQDKWLFLRNFAPVLVLTFYGDCLTRLYKTNGFCCETLHQFWCETFSVISWHDYTRRMAFVEKLCISSGLKLLRWLPDMTTQDKWLLLRNFAPVLMWNFYGDCLTRLYQTNGFCCETLHQFWCETFSVI